MQENFQLSTLNSQLVRRELIPFSGLPSMKPVTIIIPAYNQFPALEECIASLKEHVHAPHQVLIINDASTEENFEQNVAAAIEGDDRFRLESNEQNLGFVQTCNRGVLELSHPDHDVLLLNNDTVVTENFLEEMIACLYAHERHAVCCPRSNDAHIFTIPQHFCSETPLSKEEFAQKSYACFRHMQVSLPRFSVVFTGMGFCMLIRRSTINRFGLFDEIYGRGYEEENDFCSRINRYGFSTVMANRAYVYHHQAYSIPKREKQQLKDRNNQILQKRYPEYWKEHRDYHGWYQRAAEHFADILGQCYSRPRILIDLSHLTAAHNGTSEYAMNLLPDLIPLLEQRANVHVLANRAVAHMFKLTERGWRIIWNDEPLRYHYHLSFTPHQIASPQHFVLLNDIATKMVVNVQDVIALRCQYLKVPDRQLAFEMTMQYCNGIVSVSETSLQDVCAYAGNLSHRTNLLMRPILHGYAVDEDERNRETPYYGVSTEGRLIFLIGNHFNHKAVKIALKHLSEEHHVVALGGDPHWYPDRENTTYLQSGSLDDGTIERWLSESDVILFPSQYEGFGLPLLHAARHAKPILVSASAVNAEVTKQFNLQEIVHTFDTFEELDDTIERILNLEKVSAPQKVRTWRHSAKETAEFLFTVLDQPIDIDHLQERWKMLKTLERKHNETQEVIKRTVVKHFSSHVGRKLNRFPRFKRRIQRLLHL